MSRALELTAADGTRLAACCWLPTGGRAGGPRQAVVVAGALGVPQRRYAAFCEWLAAQGHTALSFDPRGIGASRAPQHRRSLRGLDIDLLGWARQDFAAAVTALSAQVGGQPVAVLGHSLGLHHALMTEAPTQARIARAVGVASGAGWWRDWAAPSRRRAPLLLHVAGPLLTPLFGYFPGRRLHMVADLPAGVMRQWGRWCRHPDFAWGAEPALLRSSLQGVRFAVSAFSFTDDEAMTAHCTQRLLDMLPHAATALVRVAPADVGLARIAHLGAFRPEAAAQLWPRLAAALST